MPVALSTSLVPLVCSLAIPWAKAQEQEQPPTPAAQFRALMDEYRPNGPATMTDAERILWIGRSFQRHSELAVKLVELAKRHAEDPIAVDALIEAARQVNTTPWSAKLVGEEPARPEALALLLRDHAGSDKLASLCVRISFGFCKEYEGFLRGVLERSPHRQVQAEACLGLARHLTNRLGKLDFLAGQPEATREFAELFGSDYLAALREQDRGKVLREAARLFERAAAEFGELTYSGEQKIGDLARGGLFELEHLQVGCAAPEIEGDDQDGVRFKLSDYRGKVVLLDFWHTH